MLLASEGKDDRNTAGPRFRLGCTAQCSRNHGHLCHTYPLFFAVNPASGKVNDAVSVVQAVLMLPVAVAMAMLTYPVSGMLAWLAPAVGSLAMVVTAVLQALLVFGRVRFEQTIVAVLAAGHPWSQLLLTGKETL